MKTVTNSKTWDENGWTYRMKRFSNGKMFGNQVMIGKCHMHQREYVAWKLRSARKELQYAIERDKQNILYEPA